jgi:hypothetical protein
MKRYGMRYGQERGGRVRYGTVRYPKHVPRRTAKLHPPRARKRAHQKQTASTASLFLAMQHQTGGLRPIRSGGERGEGGG